MPIMLPAPALFSTKNGWPSALDKCCASTRARMSVPPPGGEGTITLTGRIGYSVCPQTCPQERSKVRVKSLAHCIQSPPIALHRLGGDQDERDDARIGAAVHPVVHGAALHQDIARAQMHRLALELHVDF